MQEIAVAGIVAIAVALLAVKAWQAVRRRCGTQSGGGCGKCGKCG
jgi:hypothetical protein